MKKRIPKKLAGKSPQRKDSAARKRAQQRAIAQFYFDGLAKKDLSRVPWDDSATLRAPLNPQGGAVNPIVGRENILGFLTPLLPNLGKIEVLRHFVEGDWVCTRANVRLASNPAVSLRVMDSFRIKNGKIVEQENHYDPRPALSPSA